MGIFSRSKPEDQYKPSIKPAAPNGGIAYDAELVTKLKEDHQELVAIYTAIKSAATEQRFGEIGNLLANFKLNFQTHIAVENVRFYVYVQQHEALDADTSSFIADVRKEMNGIARAVLKFVETHTATPPTTTTAGGFISELEQIGAVLTQRVQLEESRLYTLYQP